MKLRERLEAALKKNGVNADDCALWLERIHALSFDRAEVFVYLLEKAEKDEVLFLNKNLKSKIGFAAAGTPSIFENILAEEKTYLSRE